MTKVNDVTWVQKVLARLDLNDEGKVGLFGDTLKREWKKAIRDNQRQISQIETELEDKLIDLNEKLVDLKEDYINSFEEVNVDKIDTSTNRKDYVKEFTKDIVSRKNTMLTLEGEISDTKDSYKARIEKHNEKIKELEEFLSHVE